MDQCRKEVAVLREREAEFLRRQAEEQYIRSHFVEVNANLQKIEYERSVLERRVEELLIRGERDRERAEVDTHKIELEHMKTIERLEGRVASLSHALEQSEALRAKAMASMRSRVSLEDEDDTEDISLQTPNAMVRQPTVTPDGSSIDGFRRDLVSFAGSLDRFILAVQFALERPAAGAATPRLSGGVTSAELSGPHVSDS